MEVPSSEEILQRMSSSLSQIKWRLKASSKRRLDIVSHMLESVSNALNGFHGTDVLALCTGMRPVVMIDYGGKLPELQTRLLSLLELLQEMAAMMDHTSALDEANSSQSSLFIDLSCCLQDTKVTIPTLNGFWFEAYLKFELRSWLSSVQLKLVIAETKSVLSEEV
ncbi:hypothetical protein F2Q69_00014711 [Brassica cretica]|uniref:Uncharacterized protein n=1 Tax=Brassica cretica TaxID=69181 RepID=A0A8S9QG07_BRACR|nr:hypothetical protein F2Q69_00014711 [Brassica cretica]